MLTSVYSQILLLEWLLKVGRTSMRPDKSCERGSGGHSKHRDCVANVTLYITVRSKLQSPNFVPSFKSFAYLNRMPLTASENSQWFQNYGFVKFAILSRRLFLLLLKHLPTLTYLFSVHDFINYQSL